MKIKLNQNVSTRGYYKLFVKDKDGNIKNKSFTDPINNVVTNLGREQWFSGSSTVSDDEALFNRSYYLAVGDGNTERVRSDIALGNQLFSRDLTSSGMGEGFTDNGDGTETFTKVCVASFALGEITGTISEVGVFESSSGSDLIAGQLIKDTNGDPTTLTIQSDEQLSVEYTVEWTYTLGPKTGPTGSVTIKGTSYNYSVQFAGIRKSPGGNFLVPFNEFGSTVNQNFSFYDSSVTFLGSTEHTETRTSTPGSSYNFQFTATVPPSEFSSSDIKDLRVASRNISGSEDITENFGPTIIITFDTPFEKTLSEAINLDIDFTITVT